MRALEFITEAIPTNSRAPLYHSTRAYRGLQILKDKAIRPGRDGHVSLTRDYNLNYRELGLEEDPHVTFVIDQNKLRQQQRVSPYSYTGTEITKGSKSYDPEFLKNRGGRIESEEHTKLPVPLNTVTGVIINRWELDNDAEGHLQTFIQQCKQLNIPVTTSE